MPGLGALWDSLVDCICRPPRDEYSYPDELVGGSRRLFRVGRCPGLREDLTLVNKRGLRLQCSHYLPRHVRGKEGRLPCVIYCHCNSGSRRDAEEAICVLIPQGVSVFTLDFAGSGLSEGQWVTLGAEEVDDVSCAVEHLRASGRVSTLGLWGRSMGAVTALLYSQRDPSIAGMVLDSPFSRLTDLMLEIVQEQRLPIPRPLARLALAAMRRSVQKRAGFDITKVSPVDSVSQSFIPALFGHATGDTFIRISHAEALFGAYAGDKNLIRFDGDHNSRRPEFFYNSVSIFWHNTLQLEELLEPAEMQQYMANQAAAFAAAAAGAANRPPRGLRPPPPSQLQPRVRQPLSPLPAAPPGAAAVAAAAAPADVGSNGSARSSSESETAATTSATSATAAAGGAGGGSAPGPATASGSGSEWRDGDEDGADVAGPGRAARSAPWEPRLWEAELDKTLLERQRFRRMAGGLPSPPGTGAAGVGGGSMFRSSEELRHLLANASDDSVLARLLGEGNVQMSDDASEAATTAAAAGGRAAAGVGAAVAASARGAGASPGLWLPNSEEEEEAQLQAALELSLLEMQAAAAAVAQSTAGSGARCGGGTTSGGGGSNGARSDGGGSGGGLCLPALHPTHTLPPPTATGNGPLSAGAGAAQLAWSQPLPPLQPQPHPTSASSQQQQQQQQQRVGGSACDAVLVPFSRSGSFSARQDLGGTNAAGSTADAASGTREGPAPTVPAAGGGPEPALRSSLIFPSVPASAPAGSSSSSATAASAAAVMPPSPFSRSISHEPTGGPGAPTSSVPQAALPRSSLSALPGSSLPAHEAGHGPPGAIPAAAGAPDAAVLGRAASGRTSANGGASGRRIGVGLAATTVAAGGPSVYDLYSEEELLALALQLSLQEQGMPAS